MNLPTRGDVGLKEMTRDPIFLLQYLEKDYIEDGEPQETLDYWTTESVWFTREEAEAWAKSHAYRFRHGTRVYCLCAEGELAALLKAHTLKPTGSLERLP